MYRKDRWIRTGFCLGAIGLAIMGGLVAFILIFVPSHSHSGRLYHAYYKSHSLGQNKIDVIPKELKHAVVQAIVYDPYNPEYWRSLVEIENDKDTKKSIYLLIVSLYEQKAESKARP